MHSLLNVVGSPNAGSVRLAIQIVRARDATIAATVDAVMEDALQAAKSFPPYNTDDEDAPTTKRARRRARLRHINRNTSGETE